MKKRGEKGCLYLKFFLLIIGLIFLLTSISAAGYPQFSNYWDNNGTQTAGGTGYFNVTLLSTNGTVVLRFNSVDYTASNSSGDATKFYVAIPSLSAGTYSYNWFSYGDDIDNFYNTSDIRSYTVNATLDTISPHFTNLANQSFLQGQSLNYDIDAVDSETGLGSFAINWTNTFSIVSSTGVLTNSSALSAGDYYINVSVNDTLGNLNSTILLISAIADTNLPDVTLVSPLDGYVKTASSTMAFTYSVTDSSNIAICSLIINGAIDQSNSSAITKGTDEIFTKSLQEGEYNWSVNCTDIANNQGKSTTYSLTVRYAASSQNLTGSSNFSGSTNLTSNLTLANDTNYTSSNNSGNSTSFGGAISSFTKKIGEFFKNLVGIMNPVLKPFLEVSKPYLLWIFTGIGIVILLVIVLWRLKIILKKVNFKRFIKKREKPTNIKEKKTIEFPIEKDVIKSSKEAQKKWMGEGVSKSVFNLPTEKKIIEPNKAIQSKYGGEKGEEYLRRRIKEIEKRQRIRVLKEIKKQSRELHK